MWETWRGVSELGRGYVRHGERVHDRNGEKMDERRRVEL